MVIDCLVVTTKTYGINMLSIIHYVSAYRRLKESDKTIMMLGGVEECQEMIVAQNEMIRLEKEYYHEEMVKLGYICLILTMVCVILYIPYHKGWITL
jgi:hypothetical protein